MIYEELKTPLRIYNQLHKQDRYIKNYNDVFFYKLITPRDTPLPFQFRVPVASGGGFEVSQFLIRNVDGTTAFTLPTDVINNLRTINNVDYVIYKPEPITVDGSILNMPSGFYYVELVVNGYNYVSEVFYVPCNPFSWNDTDIAYTRLDWDNGGCDLGPILYKTGYKNTIFLDTSIMQETPEIQEEGFEDGINNFTPTLQKYIDNLVIDELMPFFLADALVLASMHRRVDITLPFNTYSSRLRNLKSTIAPQEDGRSYLLTLRFQQESKYVNANCCTNIPVLGGNMAITSVTITPANDAGGNVTYKWAFEGDASLVKIIAQNIGGICVGAITMYIPITQLEIMLPGHSNDLWEVEIIPIAILFGDEYMGDSVTEQFNVENSSLCV